MHRERLVGLVEGVRRGRERERLAPARAPRGDRDLEGVDLGVVRARDGRVAVLADRDADRLVRREGRRPAQRRRDRHRRRARALADARGADAQGGRGRRVVVVGDGARAPGGRAEGGVGGRGEGDDERLVRLVDDVLCGLDLDGRRGGARRDGRRPRRRHGRVVAVRRRLFGALGGVVARRPLHGDVLPRRRRERDGELRLAALADGGVTYRELRLIIIADGEGCVRLVVIRADRAVGRAREGERHIVGLPRHALGESEQEGLVGFDQGVFSGGYGEGLAGSRRPGAPGPPAEFRGSRGWSVVGGGGRVAALRILRRGPLERHRSRRIKARVDRHPYAIPFLGPIHLLAEISVAAEVWLDGECRVGDVGHRDPHVLAVGVAVLVDGVHGDLVDIVSVIVQRVLEVPGGHGEDAAVLVDGEEGRVVAVHRPAHVSQRVAGAGQVRVVGPFLVLLHRGGGDRGDCHRTVVVVPNGDQRVGFRIPDGVADGIVPLGGYANVFPTLDQAVLNSADGGAEFSLSRA